MRYRHPASFRFVTDHKFKLARASSLLKPDLLHTKQSMRFTALAHALPRIETPHSCSFFSGVSAMKGLSSRKLLAISSAISFQPGRGVSPSPSQRFRVALRVAGAYLLLLACSQLLVSQTSAHFQELSTVALSGIVLQPNGIAVDAAGNLYLANTGTRQLLKEPRTVFGYGSPIVLADTSSNGSGFQPQGVAIDSALNLYFSDLGGNKVIKLPWNSTTNSYGTQAVLASTATNGALFSPVSIALDNSGNVYIADAGNAQFVVLPWNSSTSSYGAQTLLPGSYHVPSAVAVNSIGDVFVADTGYQSVWQLPWNGSSYDPAILVASTTGSLSGFEPTALAVDSGLNLYVGDNGDNQVLEVFWQGGGYTSPTPSPKLGDGVIAPSGLAMDADGNLFVSEHNNAAVGKLQLAAMNLGTVDVGQASAVVSVPFTFDTGGTLDSTVVLTQGAQGLDFTDAGTGTCVAGHSYNLGDLCTVNVKFTPRFPGLSMGAVQLNAGGAAIASTHLRGMGHGPQIVFPSSYASSLLFKIGMIGPYCGPPVVGGGRAALDAAGDLFFPHGCSVVEVKAVGGIVSSASPVITVTGSFAAAAVAVDGAGNVWVADESRSLTEIVAYNGQISSSSPIVQYGTGHGIYQSVAVDADGNAFLSEEWDAAVKEFVAVNGSITSASPWPIVGPGIWGFYPEDANVDAQGNVWAANGSRLIEIVAVNGKVSGASQVIHFPNVVASQVQGVDAAGDVFTNYGELVASNGVVSPSSYTQGPTGGYAIDAQGNVYGGAYNGDYYVALYQYSVAPSLTFGAAADGTTSSDSPKVATVANNGNADLTFPLPTSGTNPSISPGFAIDASTTCPQSAPGTLQPGPFCNYAVNFSPLLGQIGTVDGNLNLIDNSMNALAPNYTFQGVSLEGTGLAITVTTAANVITGYSPADQYVPVSATVTSPILVNQGQVTFVLVDSSNNSIGGGPYASVVNGVATGGYILLHGGTPAGVYTIQALFEDGCVSTPCPPHTFADSSDYTHTLTIVSTGFVVNTNADDATGVSVHCPFNPSTSGPGSCTLRDALASSAASGYGSISFDPAVFTSTNLTSNPGANTIVATTGGALQIPTNTTVNGLTAGSGASLTNLVTVSGGSAITVFTVLPGAQAVLSNLNVMNGAAGLVVNDSASTVEVLNSTFSNNVANCTIASTACAGAISNAGTLTVTNDTFSGNSANGSSLPIQAAGAILNTGNLTINYSTFTRNSAQGFALGGGAIASTGTLFIDQGTVSGNWARNNVTGSGGIYDTGLANFRNNILSGNWLGTASAPAQYDDLDDNTGSTDFLTSLGNIGSNVVGYYNGPQAAPPSPAIALAPLGNYGGPTQTMVPLPGSPAICAWTGWVLPSGVDQRGEQNYNVTYPGYGFSWPLSPCFDAGSVQTNYALAFVQQPSNVGQNTAMSPAPTVELQESSVAFADNTDSIPIPLTLTGNGVLTNGSASTSANTGSATYSGLSINQLGTGDTLTANLALNATILISATSNPFDVTMQAPVQKLAFLAAPPAQLTAGGNAGSAVKVQEEDSTGTLVSSATDTITLTVTGPGSYSRSYTSAAVGGIAIFNLSSTALNTSGNYTYTASLTGTTDATAHELVNAGSISTLIGTGSATSGQSAVIGMAYPYAFTVAAVDTYGNPVSGVTISYSVPGSGASAALSALSSTTNSAGTASVTGTANGKAGSFQLSASAIDVSTPVTFSVSNTKAATTLTITPTATSIVYGQAVTVNAAIAPSSVLTSVLTGNVTWYDGSTPVTPDSTVSGATSSYTVNLPSAGSHTYMAQYLGDTNFAASPMTSATLSVAVSQAAPTLSLTCTEVTYDGSAHSCTGTAKGVGGATVAGSWNYSPSSVTNAGTIPVTGTFTSTDANYTNGTAGSTLKIDAASQTIAFAPSSPVTYGVTPITLSATGGGSGNPVTFSLVSGPGSLTGSMLTITGAGTVVVTANQSGNANFTAAAQVTKSIVVNQATTAVRLACGSNPTFMQSPFTLSATVSSSVSTPTGSVSFLDGSTPLGSGTVSGGVAALTVSSMAMGSHSITAAYGGDTNFLASTSGTLTQMVEDFSVTAASSGGSTQTAPAGGTATYSLVVTPIGGATFPSAVTLSISGLPTGATATFTPQVVPAGSSTSNVALTIQLPSVAAKLDRKTPLNGKAPPLLWGILLLPFIGRLRRAGKRLGRKLSVLLLIVIGVAAMAGLSGCNSTSGFFDQLTNSYTIAVTGTSGTLSHSTSVTLTVQ